jgi:hypothetical protein
VPRRAGAVLAALPASAVPLAGGGCWLHDDARRGSSSCSYKISMCAVLKRLGPLESKLRSNGDRLELINRRSARYLDAGLFYSADSPQLLCICLSVPVYYLE